MRPISTYQGMMISKLGMPKGSETTIHAKTEILPEQMRNLSNEIFLDELIKEKDVHGATFLPEVSIASNSKLAGFLKSFRK